MSNWYEWERELISRLQNEDKEFLELFSRHQALEQEVKELEERAYLSEEQQLRLSTLKREKLRVRDRIEEILRAHKKVVLPA